MIVLAFASILAGVVGYNLGAYRTARSVLRDLGRRQ